MSSGFSFCWSVAIFETSSDAALRDNGYPNDARVHFRHSVSERVADNGEVPHSELVSRDRDAR
jgi:hypothetical protein